MIGHARRALASTLAGWLVAWLATLPFTVAEVARNAGPGFLLPNLAAGLGLWGGFTLAVCGGVGVGLVLPASILLPWALLRRFRWSVIVAAGAFGVTMVGDRLGTWIGLVDGSPGNPFDSRLFWRFSLFAIVFSLATVLIYTRAQRA